MSDPAANGPSESGAAYGRRTFLRNAAILAGAAAVPQVKGTEPETSAAGSTEPASLNYLSLSATEAAFTEAMMDVMCPADALTPRGTDCGLTIFIDRQLAGAYGKGDRLYMRGPWRAGRPEHGYQLPLTPEQFFKAGIASAGAACERKHGKRFEELAPADADTFLSQIGSGDVTDERVPLAEWFDDLVYPLFIQACFADPVYGGNRGKVFWKMLGYPGLPAVNGLNLIKYRGKPFPGAKNPQSMEDFG